MKRFLKVVLALAIIVSIVIATIDINHVGLKVLSLVKKIQGNSVDVAGMNTDNSITISHAEWDGLLMTYVDDAGIVDYIGLEEAERGYLSCLSDDFKSEPT